MGGAITVAGILAAVEAWEADGDGEAEKSRELVRMLLNHTPAPFSREQFTPGHITATACVLNPSGDSVLLVHHKRLGLWLFPGGHIEAEDATAADAARREAVEETGVKLAPAGAARLAGIDVHGIPARGSEPYHLHHDLVFGFRAEAEAIQGSEETRAVVWRRFEEFARYGLRGSMRRCALRAASAAGR